MFARNQHEVEYWHLGTSLQKNHSEAQFPDPKEPHPLRRAATSPHHAPHTIASSPAPSAPAAVAAESSSAGSSSSSSGSGSSSGSASDSDSDDEAAAPAPAAGARQRPLVGHGRDVKAVAAIRDPRSGAPTVVSGSDDGGVRVGDGAGDGDGDRDGGTYTHRPSRRLLSRMIKFVCYFVIVMVI